MIRRNDLFRMLGHNLRVTTVKTTNRVHEDEDTKTTETIRRVFLTCAKDCNCGPKLRGRLIYPVALEIMEHHLNKVTLDKL